LSGTSFVKVFERIDSTAKNLIAEATKASGHVRRAAAQIVVEGVRLFRASEAATDDWQAVIKRELTDCGIKINQGDNLPFRQVANLLFRGVTKVKDDADLADAMISRGQITRYAQAMAWAYQRHKAGTDLGLLSDEIVALGGVRKVADCWAEGQRHATEEDENTLNPISITHDEPHALTSDRVAVQAPQPFPAPSRHCQLLDTMQVPESLLTKPILAALYPGGSVYQLDLPEKQIAAIFSRIR
jgi:hypothetical protein